MVKPQAMPFEKCIRFVWVLISSKSSLRTVKVSKFYIYIDSILLMSISGMTVHRSVPPSPKKSRKVGYRWIVERLL